MHILFIHTSQESLAIEYLSATLKQNHHKVSLIFDPNLKSSFRLNISHSSTTDSSYIASLAIDKKPDLVCFSVESDYFYWASAISFELKNISSIPIIMGGIHPSSKPEEVLLNSAADFVCIGEGEEPLLELIDQLNRPKEEIFIPNIWIKINNQILKTPIRNLNQNLDKIPFPDKNIFYDIFPGFVSDNYSIITGRGCPNNCSYCYNSSLKKTFKGKGQYYRRRNVKNVIDELVSAKKIFNFKRISFCDDIFTSDINWLKEFVNLYITKVNLPYYCASHPSFLDKEKIDLLERSGCSSLNIGIQTLNDNLRKHVLNRSETIEDIENILSILGKTKIFTFTNFIFGIPGQTITEIEKILQFCSENKIDFHDVNWLRYYPNTAIIQKAKDYSILTDDDIKAINTSLNYNPYAHGGHSYTIMRSKLRNMVFISNFLNKRTIEFIIKNKLYKYIPSCNLRNLVVILRLFYKKYFFNKKNPYPNFSIFNSIKFYLYFLLNKIQVTKNA